MYVKFKYVCLAEKQEINHERCNQSCIYNDVTALEDQFNQHQFSQDLLVYLTDHADETEKSLQSV